MSKSNKYQNKYRIPSARLHSYDYARAGAYIVTICTKNRFHYFGKIEKSNMQLSELGNNVMTEWTKTPDIGPDMNIELGEFVVMPNHFHAILIIGDNQYNMPGGICRDAMHCVSTNTTNTTNAFQPQSKNRAFIMRGFKSSITTYARKNNIPFDWQPRFHDHIIQSKAAYERIKQYILNKPAN